MTDTDDPQYRAYHDSDPGRVKLRESDDEDGVFTVRMPIASTGEVRNEGDDPLSRDDLSGMATQVANRSPAVFLDHGSNMDIGGSRYSAVGKVGEWTNPDLVENDAGETLLEADARLMDPDTLPDSTGAVREALAALKAQVDRDMGLSSSIGWREDESYPGGNDLMEASIVGIPADPRTTSQDAPAALARAALETREDVDPEQLVADFRAVVMGPDDHDHDQGDDARDSVTDDETTQSEEATDAETDDTNDEQDEMDAQAYRESMLEMQRQQTETLSTLADAIREEDEDEDDESEDDDEDEDEDDDEGEQSADTDDDGDDTDRTVEVDGEELDVDDVVSEHKETLHALREGGLSLDDIDLSDAVDVTAEDEQSAESDDQTTDDTTAETGGWLA